MENPDWEERVYQEAQLLLGNDQLTFEQLNGCGFNDIRRVKRETLRLLPPGYLRTREAAYDEYLGEYHIPRGSIIFVSPYTLHRMEELENQMALAAENLEFEKAADLRDEIELLRRELK
jgi:cytochrome P450